ncbi:hypothetical protein SAMN02910298_02938 [Pseudobutyrivibrio sp. YE44]|uniref:hypothetical protein n=1 Tax=Pseudobutyrivibrio sp. YE44 TaxID=1520802 RepID=UPI000885A4DC|nr:hypothetical protein [Pseudobutyrivibrio sp. YE44]SDB56993.1 hypothetical protein SAMN02910298_02938 [Pseudobutyrivibrio sp. YE44]
MKKIVIIASIFSITCVLLMSVYFVLKNRNTPTVEPDCISSFYGSRNQTDSNKIYFDEDKLEVAAFRYNWCYGTDYTYKDMEHAYFEKNELYTNYLEIFYGDVIDEIYNSFEYITGKEYDAVFSYLSDRQKSNVENIYLEEQQMAYEYYGKKINFFTLTAEQQLEFYNLYKDPDYKLNDEILKNE